MVHRACHVSLQGHLLPPTRITAPMVGSVCVPSINTETLLRGSPFSQIPLYQSANNLPSLHYENVSFQQIQDDLWCVVFFAASVLVSDPHPSFSQVNLGKSGLKVSKIILGAMTYGSSSWQSWVLDEEESIKHIKTAYDAGINAFDTADVSLLLS